MKVKKLRQGDLVFVYLWGVMRQGFEYPWTCRTRKTARQLAAGAPGVPKKRVVKVILSWREKKEKT